MASGDVSGHPSSRPLCIPAPLVDRKGVRRAECAHRAGTSALGMGGSQEGLLLPHVPCPCRTASWDIWGGKGPWGEGPSQPITVGDLGGASVSPSVNKGVMMAASLGGCESVARAGPSQAREQSEKAPETCTEHLSRAQP